MATFQLWSRDEYGQGSIISSSDNVDELIREGKKAVHDLNVENVLTADEKRRNWEAYFVEIDSNDSKIIYAGKNPHNEEIAYVIKKGEVSISPFKTLNKTPKIYLGELEGHWYAEDNRKRVIDSLSHPDLLSKTVYFIKKI